MISVSTEMLGSQPSDPVYSTQTFRRCRSSFNSILRNNSFEWAWNLIGGEKKFVCCVFYFYIIVSYGAKISYNYISFQKDDITICFTLYGIFKCLIGSERSEIDACMYIFWTASSKSLWYKIHITKRILWCFMGGASFFCTTFWKNVNKNTPSHETRLKRLSIKLQDSFFIWMTINSNNYEHTYRVSHQCGNIFNFNFLILYQLKVR